ncbi:MAG: RecX family transcriptional regulator [Clostridia bacterium]|nr:RecX family transcriptional regulator [Clostridia bacterium]
MEIFSIKLAKRSANVFIADTDSGEYRLHSDVIVKNNIRVGDVDDSTFFESVEESEVLIGYNLALKYIGASIKTEKQIRDYLYRKEYHKDPIDKIILKLKEYKIIDDKIYADIFVKSNPNFSRLKLKQKLNSNGIKNDLVDIAIENVDDIDSAMHHAEKFLRNKASTKENIDKMIRRLTYLGYNWDSIRQVLNRLRYDTEDIE